MSAVCTDNCVAQANLELWSSASASEQLGLKACATAPALYLKLPVQCKCDFFFPWFSETEAHSGVQAALELIM